MRKLVKAFLANQSGATAIEYALLAGGIAGVMIVAVTTLGTQVNGVFNNLGTNFPH